MSLANLFAWPKSPRRLEAGTERRLEAAESLWRAQRPWLLVREEDAILIAPPNKVFKLGGSALPLLRFLEAGGRLRDLPGPDGGRGPGEERAREVIRFFDEFEAACEGRSPEGGFGTLPYGFDFTRLPVLGEIALTYRCNERCRFCYASCGSEASCGNLGCGSGQGRFGGPGSREARGEAGSELSTAEWKRVIEILKREAKIPFFSFTGGEPLLRPDLEELAAHALSLGLRVNLITNGSLATPERAASLKAAGIDTAQVSLESPDPAVHDALCDTKGAWERTTAGIGALLAAGVSVQTNTTLTTANAPTLSRLPALLRELGVRRFSMNLFIPAGRGLGNEDLFVPYSEAGAHVDTLRREAHRAGLTFFWYSPTPYCIYNPVARGLGNKSCAAVDGLVHVNPSGDILPCSSWPEALGKILEKPFAELWFSERAAYFKNKRFAPAACEGCASFIACQGACPLYWRYAGEAELATARPALEEA